MDTPLIDPKVLFAEDDSQHVCCSCCEGYCPMVEDGTLGDPWPWMYQIEIEGVAYLTDRYVAVRADVCQPMPDSVTIQALPTHKDTAAKGFVVPDVQPLPTRSKITARTWDMIDRAGLTVHGEPADGLRVLHLYQGVRHVGWVMTSSEGTGIAHDELAMVRRVVQNSGITLRQAEIAMRTVMEG